MLVGDPIISARALMPDLPRTLPGPTGLAAAVIGVPGSTLPPGTYNLVFTFTNIWGETIGSNIVTGLIVAANQGIQVTAPLFNTNPSATGCRVYFALTGQPFLQYQAQSSLAGLPFTISTPGTPGTPPTRNTSFFPDSDGNMVSAYTMFDWLNDALTVAAYICKGIPDVSGIQMFSGQGFYTMPGIWDKLENCWYDGYPVAFDSRSGAFYRNVLSGITFIGILQTSADRQILELQPQPSRTGGTDTLIVQAGLTDSTLSLTGQAGTFGLALGMAALGNIASGIYEIVSYGTISAPGLIGVSRGLGGTQQQAWPIGTSVTELNFRFGGLRLNQQIRYSPGSSLTTLQVPPGWKPALVDYLVGKFREGEQNTQSAGESLKKFAAFLKDYNRGTKQTAGPRQVGSSTPAGDGYPSASSGGRIIVP